MTDDIDRAQDRDAEYTADCVAQVSYKAAQHRLGYTGHCHFCGDITGGGRRFCDADCRDDYERERRLKKQIGKGC